MYCQSECREGSRKTQERWFRRDEVRIQTQKPIVAEEALKWNVCHVTDGRRQKASGFKQLL